MRSRGEVLSQFPDMTDYKGMEPKFKYISVLLKKYVPFFMLLEKLKQRLTEKD